MATLTIRLDQQFPLCATEPIRARPTSVARQRKAEASRLPPTPRGRSWRGNFVSIWLIGLLGGLVNILLAQAAIHYR